MELSHSIRAIVGACILATVACAHASGDATTTLTLTGLVVKDKDGNVVPTVLAPTSIAQNSYASSFVYTHGLINADGDYLEIADSRRRQDLLAWSTHFTVPTGTNMSARATTSGGFFNTLTAQAFADEFNATVNAQAEVFYDILVPANGSVTVSGTMFGYALSTGEPTGPYNVPHTAGFDTFLIISPPFVSGEVYRVTGEVSSATPPFSPAETSQPLTFAQTFVNPVAFDWYAHVDMIASAHVGNAALASAVPEPASWLMAAAGLVMLARLARRRTG